MSGRKPPCKFFQQGKCRNGSRCQFPHVYENNTNQNGNGGSSFVGTPKSHRQEVERFANAANLDSRDKELRDTLDVLPEMDCIVTSSMGFQYPATENLISGRDYSFEESRWDFYQAQQQNALPQYEQSINARVQDMKMCIDEIRKDSRKAARYTQLTAQQKLNDPTVSVKPFLTRPLDITGNSLQQQPGPFGAQNSSPFGATGSTNAFGSQTSPFGKPAGGAFGAQSLGATSNTTSGFGSSGFGSANSNTSPFGGSSLGTTPAAGAFGSQGFGSAGVGAQPQPGATSAFGQSGFGTASKAPSPFGAAAASKPSAFGTSSLGSSSATPAFGSTGFGTTPAASGAVGSPGFGTAAASSTSPFASLTESKPATSTPFAQASTTSAFGPPAAASTAPTSSPFGNLGKTSTSNAFGPQATTSAFGSSGFGQATQPAASPFGTSVFGQQTSTTAFGQPSQSSAFGSGLFGGFGNALGATTGGPSGNFVPSLKQSDNEPERLSPDELSENVRKQFEASEFTMGMVPEVEPPLVYC